MSSEESLTDTKIWTEEHLQSALADSTLLKAEGNDYFAQKNWQNAIVAYQQALDALPPPLPVDRKGKGKANEERSDDGEDGEQQETVSTNKESPQTESESWKEQLASNQPLTPLQKECSAARVVLFSNMAQCHIKLVRPSELSLLLSYSEPVALLGRMAEGRGYVHERFARGPAPPEVSVEEG